MDDRELEILQKFFDMLKAHSSAFESSTEDMSEATEKFLKRFNPDKTMAKFDKSIEATSGELKEFDEAIKDFDKAISSAAAGSSKQEDLKKQRADLANKRDQKAREEDNAERVKATQNVTKTVGAAFTPLTKTVGQLTSAFQSNATGSEMGEKVMGAGIDLFGAAAGGLTKGVQGIGATMTQSLNPAIALAGVGLSVVGTVAGAAAEGLTKLLKFGNEVLSKEVDKTVKAFNDASNSGAIFSDGMLGIKTAATASGLTIEQFSAVIKKSSGQLAEGGLGVAEGAKKVGDVGRIIKASGVQDKLLKLGVGFEEQAELTAETIANMRRSSGGALNNQQVAQETEKYANNLKTLSAITGEDAKAKTEKVKQENTELAFQLKLGKMSSAQRAQINVAMASMTEQERKNLKDRMVYGTVVNKAGAIYEATIDGAKELGEKQKSLLDANNLTAETNLRATHESAGKIKKGLEGLDGGIALAGFHAGGDIRDMTQGAAEKLGQTVKMVDQEFEKTLADIKNVQKTPAEGGDKLTNTIIEAEKAAQALKVGVQELLLGPMEHYAEYTKKMLTFLEKQLGDLIEEVATPKGLASERSKKQMDEDGLNIAAPTTAIGFEQYADGGIAKGPRSGFLAALHGEELVLPLSNGLIRPGTEGFDELVKILESTKGLEANKTAAIAAAHANVVNSGTGQMDGFAQASMNSGASAGELKSNPLSEAMSSLANYLSSVTTPEKASSGPGSSADQVLIAEIKKLSELLTRQNMLSEEANVLRTQLVDLTESHKRIAGDIRSNTA